MHQPRLHMDTYHPAAPILVCVLGYTTNKENLGLVNVPIQGRRVDPDPVIFSGGDFTALDFAMSSVILVY